MKDPLTRLTEKTASLGNYNRKYIHIISNNIDNLIMTLEQRGVRDRVHLWNYSSEIPGEMDTILQCASDDKEKLDLLGCYFALQFLHMNLQTVDIVKLELATSQERWRTGIKLMLESGRRFRFLTKCYMERLLGIFIGDREMPEFVLLGVGTRADQDDIDLGVIYEGPYESDALNRAIGFLSSEMLKKATRLHCHLSEHVGQRSFAATIEDYEEILEKGMYDFVIVTEMLGAAVIIGSDRLFEQFQERVTDRFYYNANSDQGRYHEGYLRGILGEIHSLLTRPKPSDTIFPKDEGLRPIKTLLSALKLTHGVRKTDTWEIIDELKEKNPNREQQYQDIKQALSFIEIFRHLYQILVAQDEDIGLYEPSIDSMVANIAEMIGFEKKGVVSAKDFMMVNYYEFLEKSHKAIDILAGDLRKHLKDISIFKSIFAGEIFDNAGYKGNLAVCFIRTSRFFKGISYWDDFLEELGDDSKEFYDEFIASFNELPERMMKVIG
ncbi:MAG: hypothetical protein GY855_02685, partial [candidate division Zixibacteria bacterium]|nr:hypothetical protein [candidate division Zixibacteria bacterium]